MCTCIHIRIHVHILNTFAWRGPAWLTGELLKTKTKTHCRPPRGSSASANEQRTDYGLKWLARLVERPRSPSKRSSARSRAQNKKKKLGAQGVQAARTVSMSWKWRYDIISRSTRSSRPAYMRVNANSSQDLTLSSPCCCSRSAATSSFSLLEETSAGSLSTCRGRLNTSTYRWGTEFSFSVQQGIRSWRNFLLLNHIKFHFVSVHIIVINNNAYISHNRSIRLYTLCTCHRKNKDQTSCHSYPIWHIL